MSPRRRRCPPGNAARN